MTKKEKIQRHRAIRMLTCTMQQGSQASGLSVRKLYDLIGRGELDTVMIDRRRLIVWDSLERLLLGQRPTTQHGPDPQPEAAVEVRA